MKKLIALILSLTFVLTLTACGNQNKSVTYSINGENDFFTISNGKILISDAEQTLNGGDLEIKDNKISDVSAFTTTIYAQIGDARTVLLSNSIQDKTGGNANLSCNLGKITGNILGDIELDELKDNLYFELVTTDLNGVTTEYQLPLVLTLTKEPTATVGGSPAN